MAKEDKEVKEKVISKCDACSGSGFVVETERSCAVCDGSGRKA